MDLVPPALIVARHFAAEQAAIDNLQTQYEAAARALEEFVEEHTGEEGLLEDATNDKGKVTKGAVKDQLKALKTDQGQLTFEAENRDELQALEKCLALIEAEAGAARAVKDAQAQLDAQVLATYAELTEADIKTLVVDDKWFAAIQTAIAGEVNRLTQQLAGRVKQLDERYAHTLPQLEQEVEALSATVENHLKQMGLHWAAA